MIQGRLGGVTDSVGIVLSSSTSSSSSSERLVPEEESSTELFEPHSVEVPFMVVEDLSMLAQSRGSTLYILLRKINQLKKVRAHFP